MKIMNMNMNKVLIFIAAMFLNTAVYAATTTVEAVGNLGAWVDFYNPITKVKVTLAPGTPFNLSFVDDGVSVVVADHNQIFRALTNVTITFPGFTFSGKPVAFNAAELGVGYFNNQISANGKMSGTKFSNVQTNFVFLNIIQDVGGAVLTSNQLAQGTTGVAGFRFVQKSTCGGGSSLPSCTPVETNDATFTIINVTVTP
jgi:hypothetical protein